MKSVHSQDESNSNSKHETVSYGLWERYPFLAGLVLRLFLAWLLPILLDDARFIPGVAYTDIDYHVFTDAAQHVAEGRSPYERHTYRYTPFLAALLSTLPKQGGRYLFCAADAICGWVILRLRQLDRNNTNDSSNNSFVDLLWWMYNPFAINICTRGSAESFMVLFPVLLTVMLVKAKSPLPLWTRACLAGLVHGVAIHSKLYPIIYTLSYMAYFATIQDKQYAKDAPIASFPWTDPKRLLSLIQTWIRRLLQLAPLLFLVSSIASFVSLTYLAFLWYGQESLQEGLLYHLSRVDHRHNYSMWWYPIYLARATADVGMTLLGRLLLIPQLVLLVYSSLGIAPHDLGLALFTQTYLFVILNKVSTAQYFTWYLCLLPLVSGFDYWRVRWSFLLLGISIVVWLASAYCLEMQGMAAHRIVWLASLLYFVANVNLLGALLGSYGSRTQSGGTSIHRKKE